MRQNYWMSHFITVWFNADVLTAKKFSTFRVSSPNLMWAYVLEQLPHRVFLSDQRCPVKLILQILKAGNVSYQLNPFLLYSESCIQWWHTQTRMKTRELTLRKKQAIWMLKEKRKSIRALAKTKGMDEIKSLETTSDTSNQQRPDRLSKTTAVDDRQIIKAVKMNPKRRVCKITNNFQKAGAMLWQSTLIRRLWHRITDVTRQDVNLWPAPKIERQD